jgi:hypothetical protein
VVNGAVIIKMPELLRAWHGSVKKMPRTKNNRPADTRTAQIVQRAVDFSRPYQLTRRELRKFVTEFYEFVTGKKPYGGLSGHIEKALLGLSGR